MTYTRVETTKTQSGAFTISRNFSLHPLHSKVKLSKRQIQKHSPHTFFYPNSTLPLISTSPNYHNPFVFHHSFQIFQNASQKTSPDTKKDKSSPCPFCSLHSLFFVFKLEDHSFNLRPVNFITSASEMCTKYIEIKLFNNLKCQKVNYSNSKLTSHNRDKQRNSFVGGVRVVLGGWVTVNSHWLACLLAQGTQQHCKVSTIS